MLKFRDFTTGCYSAYAYPPKIETPWTASTTAARITNDGLVSHEIVHPPKPKPPRQLQGCVMFHTVIGNNMLTDLEPCKFTMEQKSQSNPLVANFVL